MKQPAPPFVFNDDAEVKVVHVGRRGIAITLIENVLEDPESVAAFGFSASYSEDRSNLYPGMRAAMPESFSGAFRAWLTPILQRRLHRDTSFFSVVTTPSEELLPIQRIPHYDSTDPNLLAAVIYLCAPRFSGTSFYRHKRTGYEEITTENQKNYQLALDHDMRVHGPPQREYVNGDTPLFEVVFSNELKFNSAIVYPGRMLHAGNIDRQLRRPQDESEWRLTITALLETCDLGTVSF